MKLVMPAYCRNFRCIADKCTDNCCIGWGIFIDDETAEYYKNVGGDFGERLRKNIDFEEQCFINDSSHHCPFLNKNNLCDIILTLGEDKLCQICDRHPRYFEWYDDVIEGGIGLCCEEAARIVLSAENFSLSVTEAPEKLIEESSDEPCDQLFCRFMEEVRRHIMAFLADENSSLEDKLERLTAYAGLVQELIDEYEIDEVPEIVSERAGFNMSEALKLMEKTEPVDDTQQQYFTKLSCFAESHPDSVFISPDDEKELKNIALYFIWRYMMKAVFSGNLYPKLMLAVFGTRMIGLMFSYERFLNGSIGFAEKCRIAKRFSKIIEYSEDNLQCIYGNYEY